MMHINLMIVKMTYLLVLESLGVFTAVVAAVSFVLYNVTNE